MDNTARRTVVVVGHGMVGHRFVEAMRSRDTAGRGQGGGGGEGGVAGEDRGGGGW